MNPGSLDADVPIPASTGILDQQEAGALAELAGHQTAVGSSTWSGMQATGTIIYAGQNSPAYAATFSSLGSDMYRPDLQTSKGQTSTRIHGLMGKMQGGDMQVSPMDPNAALAGLFPFALLRSTEFQATTLIDHGLTNIGGVELHRITLERASLGNNPVTKARNTLATDFYFDPTSHLLVKSAAFAPTDSNTRSRSLTVVTYGDYRTVGSSLVPFRYTETIAGQAALTLQLSNVQLNPALNSTYFEF